MIIDNSAANAFRECPFKYFESYLRIHPKALETKGIEPLPFANEPGRFDFGTRWHQLMEEHYTGKSLYGPWLDENIEKETQWMLEAYKKQYPEEPFDVVDVERTFLIDLPNSHHQYAGKMDLVARHHDSGRLNIYDDKSEKRNSKENTPQKWAARTQASLYLFAAERLYGESIEAFYVNIATRPSPAGTIGPSFPPRQKLERAQEQIDFAVRDLVEVADQIESFQKKYGSDNWPKNTENCVTVFGACPFYQIHTYGLSEELLLYKFQPKTEYLHLNDQLKILP